MPTVTEEKFEFYQNDAIDFCRTYSHANTRIGACSVIHARDYQEDSIAAAVEEIEEFQQLSFDQQEIALRETFSELQQQYGQYAKQGSTAAFAAAWLDQEQKFHIKTANLGDSHIIVVLLDQDDKVLLAKRLHKLHKATDPLEKERIQNMGGYVCYGRLNANLEMSRTFGDIKHDNHGISHIPDIDTFVIELQKGQRVFVIAATDGIDELCGDLTQADVPRIGEIIKESSTLTLTQKAEKLIYHAAKEEYTQDNISVLVMQTGSILVCDGHGDSNVADLVSTNFYPCLQKISKQITLDSNYLQNLQNKITHYDEEQAAKIQAHIDQCNHNLKTIQDKFEDFLQEIKPIGNFHVFYESDPDSLFKSYNLIFASDERNKIQEDIDRLAESKGMRLGRPDSKADGHPKRRISLSVYAFEIPARLDEFLLEAKILLQKHFEPAIEPTANISVYSPTSSALFKAEVSPKTIPDDVSLQNKMVKLTNTSNKV